MAEWTDEEVFGGELSDDEVFGRKPKKTSQTLGFRRGTNRVARNIMPLAKALPYTNVNALIAEPGVELERRAIDQSIANGVRPGGAGEFVGEFVGSLPLAFVGGPAVSGALQGYAASREENLPGKLKDAALGAAGGKITAGLVKGAGRIVGGVKDANVQRMTDAGVKLTPGMKGGVKAMAKEDKLMSRPVVGNVIRADRAAAIEGFERATVDEALKPLGVRLPAGVQTGHDAVAFAQDTVSKAYDDALTGISLRPDERLVANARGWYTEAAKLPEAQQTQFQKIIEGQFAFGRAGALSDRQLKNVQSEVGRLATTYARSNNASERELGRVLFSVKDDFDAALLRQNPAKAPQLQKANQAFRGLAIVEDAASRADGGLHTTGQLKQAVRRGDNSRRKRATARGGAHMQGFSEAARATIPSVTPNSFTADRLMDAKLLANIGGVGALAGYQAGKGITNFLFAPRPAAASAVGNWLDAASDQLGRFGGGLIAHRPRD